MPFLVLIIVALFAGVELFQWVKGLVLPLPVYVLAGAFLAIASNYHKGLGALFPQNSVVLTPPVQTVATVEVIPPPALNADPNAENDADPSTP